MKINFYYVKWKMVLSEHSTLLFWLERQAPFFEIIDGVVGRIVEGGIFILIMKTGFEKEKIDSKFRFLTSMTCTMLSVSVTCRRCSIS